MRIALLAFGVALAAVPCAAQPAPESIEVTATRTPEAVIAVPASVTIVSGATLRDRNATTLADVLALVAGVQAPAGGDAGPASAVPSLLGLHEFDAFLLVVDGVPWGGAFNPAIASLDLTDVARVEVLKGAAPVAYGATAFVGVIQVIHYPAGQSENRVLLGAGSNGQVQGTASLALPHWGSVAQSLTVQGASQGFADPRTRIADGRLLYRAATALGGGQLRLDVDLAYIRSTPPSPVVRTGPALTTLTPLDANYNPANARIDENRYHAVLAYSRQTALGAWETTASYAFSAITDIRGFLRPSLIDDGSQNADSQAQTRRIGDGYADTHIATSDHGISLLYGADMLYGLGKQDSINGAYHAPLSGRFTPPSTNALHVDEINSLSDRRAFFGQYAQFDFKPDARADVLGGVRLNETDERLNSAHLDGFDPTADLAARRQRQVTRLSWMIGASEAVWHNGADSVVPYADYRDTFKPAAIDFGPDYTPDVLQPETAGSTELGLKGRLLHGALDFDADAFWVDFSNLVVATTGADGGPILQNAGAQTLRGIEAELRLHPAADLTLMLNGSYHDARFTRYTTIEGGTVVNAAGNQLPLSPHVLAAAGVLYAPAAGLFGSAIVNFVGGRTLDVANTAPTASYTTLALTAGYRFGRYELLLTGTNLSDQRPPVTQSEFGDGSYYRLNGRSVLVSVAARL